MLISAVYETESLLSGNNYNSLCFYNSVTVNVDNFFIINKDTRENLGENRSVRYFQRFSPEKVVSCGKLLTDSMAEKHTVFNCICGIDD